MTKKTTMQYGINALVLAVVFLILNTFVNSGASVYYAKQLMPIGIYIIMAVSLNLTCGFLGQLPLGHAGFMAVGAYTSAIFTKAVDFGAPNLEFGVALLLGGLVAALFGVVVGLPALRLHGDYLAIITLGFGEIIRNIILNLEITGGARNLRSIEKMTTFPGTFICVIVTVFVVQTLIRSSHGRAIISIRENEIAAAACGVNTTFYKTMAFTMAAFFAGIAGGLYAHYVGVLSANSFGFNK
jgi:branched-chain amino acid transport system permease protein